MAIADTDPLRTHPHVDSESVVYGTEEYTDQERMARFQFLTNTLTTRSDRYCAYVMIRGYDSTNFGGNAAETLRFFVMLDRSNVVDLDSSVTAFPKTGQKN